MSWLKVLLAVSAILVLPAVSAANSEPPPLVGTTHPAAFLTGLEVLDDGSARRTPDSLPAVQGWGPPAPLGRRSSSVWWVRFQFVAPVDSPSDWLVIPDPRWQRVELWLQPALGPPLAVSGLDLGAARRSLPRSDLALPLPIAPGHSAQVLMRLEANFGSYAPPQTFLLELRAADRDQQLREKSRALHGAYGGLVAALVLYNLILGLALRDRIYVLYVAFTGSFGLIWLAREGLAFEVLWPEQPLVARFSTFVLIATALTFGNLFAVAFLELPRTAPVLARVLRAAIGILGVVGLLAAVGFWAQAELILAVVALCCALTYLAAGYVAWRRGVRPARTFLLANFALVAGVVAYVLAYLRVLPVHPVAIYGAQVGSAVQMLLLAFALVERIRQLRLQRDLAQKLVREGLKAEVAERTGQLQAEKSRVEAISHEVEEANRKLVEANRRLEEASLRDQLTGIPNRRRFDRSLATEWERTREHGGTVAIILLDVDHFKAFNDRFGHQAGDRCLQRFARLLCDAGRGDRELVARWGGEEFAVLLPEGSAVAAVATAERMRTLIERVDFSPDGDRPVTITVSAGIAVAQPQLADFASPDDLLRAADDALYRAKDAGRNRVVVAPPALPLLP